MAVKSGELAAKLASLLATGGRPQFAYAWFPRDDGPPEVRYLSTQGERQPFVLWRCQIEPGETLPSLARICPLLGWYEREMTELCGVHFTDHPEPFPLVLHEGAAPVAPPLHPSFKSGGEPMAFTPGCWHLPHQEGMGLQRLPFGPVRADVLESAQFVFFYIGEAIIHYHPRLFFKHRGMEKRFAGQSQELGTVLAQRVSGVGSVAHGLAFCQAVEDACGCLPPPRAVLLRVVLAELERLYNHLHYLGYLCHTTTLKVGEAEGKLLEERVKQLNARATGSRLLRDVLAVGGLRRDVPHDFLSAELDQLHLAIHKYIDLLECTPSHLDRLITTGLLTKQVAFDQGASGPVERASGLNRDLRRDHPYAAYRDIPFDVAVRNEGDAHAREQVRMAEIYESLSLIHGSLYRLNELGPGPVRVECPPPADGAEGLGWAESPRGSLYYAVHFNANGTIRRVKIKSPSFSNWRVFPSTVHETNMMDYAINEASFGLTIAGCDR